MERVEFREWNQFVVWIDAPRAIIHRIKQLPKFRLVHGINRCQDHEGRLRSHDLLIKDLISGRLIMGHVVHVMPERG